MTSHIRHSLLDVRLNPSLPGATSYQAIVCKQSGGQITPTDAEWVRRTLERAQEAEQAPAQGAPEDATPAELAAYEAGYRAGWDDHRGSPWAGVPADRPTPPAYKPA